MAVRSKGDKSMKKILLLLIILIFANASFSENSPAGSNSFKDSCASAFQKVRTSINNLKEIIAMQRSYDDIMKRKLNRTVLGQKFKEVQGEEREEYRKQAQQAFKEYKEAQAAYIARDEQFERDERIRAKQKLRAAREARLARQLRVQNGEASLWDLALMRVELLESFFLDPIVLKEFLLKRAIKNKHQHIHGLNQAIHNIKRGPQRIEAVKEEEETEPSIKSMSFYHETRDNKFRRKLAN